MEPGIYRLRDLNNGKNELFVWHQYRKTTVGGEIYWTSKLQRLEWSEEIVELFGKFDLTYDGVVAMSGWLYPNDTKYRVRIQVRMR